MDKHLPLFDAPIDTPVAMPASSTNSGNTVATSRAAGIAAKSKAGKLRKRILEFVRQRETLGATDREVQDALGLSGDSERPRRRELQKAGAIVDSGLIRLTTSGRPAVVWRATDMVDQASGQADKPELDNLPF